MKTINLNKKDIETKIADNSAMTDMRWVLAIQKNEVNFKLLSFKHGNLNTRVKHLFQVPSLSYEGSRYEINQNAYAMLLDMIADHSDSIASMKKTWAENTNKEQPEDVNEFLNVFHQLSDLSYEEIASQFFPEDWKQNRQQVVNLVCDDFMTYLNHPKHKLMVNFSWA